MVSLEDIISAKLKLYQPCLVSNETIRTIKDRRAINIEVSDLMENWENLIYKFKEGQTNNYPVFYIEVRWKLQNFLLECIYDPEKDVLHISNDEHYVDLAKSSGKTFNRRIRHLARYIKSICNSMKETVRKDNVHNQVTNIVVVPDMLELSGAWSRHTPMVCHFDKCYNSITSGLHTDQYEKE